VADGMPRLLEEPGAFAATLESLAPLDVDVIAAPHTGSDLGGSVRGVDPGGPTTVVNPPADHPTTTCIPTPIPKSVPHPTRTCE